MKTIEKIIQSSTTPLRQDVVWIDTSDPSNPVVKIYVNGKWEISQPGGGDGYVTVKSLSKEEYDALEEKDKDTLYIVKNDPTNGHEWVDIGMVDDDGYHILWATKNIGAENPWDAGKYFAWGDTVGYYANEGHDFSRENAPYWDSENEEYTKYNNEDGLTELQPEDDAAHVQLGGLWRIYAYDKSFHEFFNGLDNEIDASHDIYCVKYINKSRVCYFPISGNFYGTSMDNVNSIGYYWTKKITKVDEESYLYMICDDGSTDSDALQRYLGAPIRPIIKVKDLSELDPTYDIYLGESKIVDNSTEDSNMTNILWEDLVVLRDNSKLVPGRYYRITDYQTTTTQDETKSAKNQFDIIVLATDVNKLSEDAKAIKHDNRYNVTFTDGITKECYVYYENTYNFVDCNTLLGCCTIFPDEFEINEVEKTINLHYPSDYLDEGELRYDYFKDCSLEAWELKYCLDNDTSRFIWASSENGINSNNINIVKPEYDSLPNKFKHVIENEGFKYSDKDCGFFINSDISETITYGFSHDYGASISTDYVVIIPSGTVINSNSEIVFCDVRDGGAQTHLKAGEINETYIEENGKGVIYYMKDEYNNECPYDFKNIQFKRKISLSNGRPELDLTDGTDTWVFTFAATSYHIKNDEWSGLKDGSLESPYKHESDANSSTYHDNVIKKYIEFYDESHEDYTKCGIQYLNDNVFLGYWEEVGSDDQENTPYYYAYCSWGATLECNCHYNTFGYNCSNNTLGHDCRRNTFGSGCDNNIFGDSFMNNTVSNGCSNNTFGSRCTDNTFEVGFSGNTSGNNCYSNTFGSNCRNNIFGTEFRNNTFGHDCSYNTFDSNCTYIIIGNNFVNNRFGKDIKYFITGKEINATTSAQTKDFIRYFIVENGVQNVNAYCTDTTSPSNYCQNIKIDFGIKGTSSSNRRQINITSQIGATANVTYQPTGSQVLNV